jgi:20S proteasome alpha/beta subunit
MSALENRKPKTLLNREGCMTIVVAMKTDGGITMASDSQTTWANSKRVDSIKITPFKTKDGINGLIGQSGNAMTGGRASEIISQMARDTDISDYRTIADLSQSAIRTLKEEMRAQQGDCPMSELREFISQQNLDCALMLAYYFEKTPYLYAIDLVHGIATQQMTDYSVLGCGSNVAEFILREHPNISKMLSGYAIALAVHVIEQVKEVDAMCGGPVRLAMIDKTGILIIPKQEETDELAGKLHAFDKRIVAERQSGIKELFDQMAREWDERRQKELEYRENLRRNLNPDAN